MVNLENYEEYMLLYADGELTPDEEQALLALVAQHPHLQKELDAYKATILQPDTAIVFADKDSLLQQEEPKRIALLANWKVYAAAASVILFAVVFTMMNNSSDTQQITIANTDTTTPIETVQETEPTEELIAKEDTTPNQRIHAEPIEPVAVKQQPTPPRKVVPVLPEKEKTVVPEPAVEPTQNEVLAKTTTNDTAIAEQMVAQKVEQPEITEQHKPIPEPVAATQKQTTEKRDRQILAKVIGERTSGLQTIGEAVNDKLMAVKDVREELKDTKVHFRIGKKELFTVRL